MIWLWVDDYRRPPSGAWTWVKTAADAIDQIKLGGVSRLSLDHDLGQSSDTGYAVAKELERLVAKGRIVPPLEMVSHSSNPVGKANIEAAFRSVERMSM